MAGQNILEKKFDELGLEATPEEFIENLPGPVKRRVEALQALQDKHDQLHTEYRKELAALDAKYEKLYSPLYVNRNDIVSGTQAVPKKDGDTDDTPDKGIPEFWLTVLMKCDTTAETIKEKDVDVLTYLKNITCDSTHNEDGANNGFVITFEFADNPYFSNKTLTKTYQLSAEDDGVLEKAIGTSIDWKPGKDVTIKILKKKPKKGGKADAKPQIKTEKVDSFFNFFSPPDLPAESDEVSDDDMEQLQVLVEADYEVGAIIREKLVPNAVRWFTGEAAEDEPVEFDPNYEGETDEDEEGEEGGVFSDEDEDDEDGSPPPKGKDKKAHAAQATGPDGQPQECKQQ